MELVKFQQFDKINKVNKKGSNRRSRLRNITPAFDKNKMARKKHLEEDSENVPAGGHYLTGSNSNVNHNHLHDNTNRFGHFQQQKQQKLKTNTSNSKINHGQSKGNKIYSTNSGKVEDSFYSVTTQLASKGLAIREMPGDG